MRPEIPCVDLKCRINRLPEQLLRGEPAVDQALQNLESWARSTPSAVEPPAVRFGNEVDWRAWVTSFYGVFEDDLFERVDQGTFEERESFE
jgi:hypothetical protein